MLAENGISVRVDRDDAPAVLLHMRWHVVRCLRRDGTGADDGDGVVGSKDASDDGIGVGHLAHRSALCRASAPPHTADGQACLARLAA
jgi:hypothetical protein